MSPKGFIVGMEFCPVPEFDYIIIWHLVVDLLTLDLRNGHNLLSYSRSFCCDKTPASRPLMNGVPQPHLPSPAPLWLLSRCPYSTDAWRG